MMEKILSKFPTDVTIEGFFMARYIRIDGRLLSIKKSRRLRNHSDEFSWGYGGSGPAQLALALLLEYTDRLTAMRHYQEFKFAWVAKLPKTDFIKTVNLREVMKEILEKSKTIS